MNGKSIKLDKIKNGIAVIKRTWRNDDLVVLKLPMKIRLTEWYERSQSVERGPWSMHCVLRKMAVERQCSRKWTPGQRFLGGSYNLSLELCVDCTRSGQNGRTLPGSGTYRRNILSLNISELRLKFGRRARKFRIGIYITALQVRCHTVFQLAEKLKRQKKISC